jgi:hypothetical protein
VSSRPQIISALATATAVLAAHHLIRACGRQRRRNRHIADLRAAIRAEIRPTLADIANRALRAGMITEATQLRPQIPAQHGTVVPLRQRQG